MAIPPAVIAAMVSSGSGILQSMAGRLGGGVDAGPTSASAREAARASDRDIEATREANKIEDNRIQDSRSWQEGMRSTAYQTSKADMEAAGLNPAVMMAGSGGVANAPGTSTMKAHKADPSGASRSASAMMQARTGQKTLMKDVALAGAGIASKWLEGKLTKARIKKTNEETATTREHGNLMRNQGYLYFAQEQLASARAAHENNMLVQSDAEAQYYRQHPWLTKYGAVTKKLGGTAQTVAGAIGLRGIARQFSSPRSRRGWGSNHRR